MPVGSDWSPAGKRGGQSHSCLGGDGCLVPSHQFRDVHAGIKYLYNAIAEVLFANQSSLLTMASLAMDDLNYPRHQWGIGNPHTHKGAQDQEISPPLPSLSGSSA